MTTPSTHGLRHYSRVPFSVQGVMQLQDRSIAVRLVDISLKGALVESATRQKLNSQDKCHLVLPLAHGGEAILMTGHIAHIANRHIGVACQDIDVTSLTQLRRLMELNVGDTELMNRELIHMLLTR